MITQHTGRLAGRVWGALERAGAALGDAATSAYNGRTNRFGAVLEEGTFTSRLHLETFHSSSKTAEITAARRAVKAAALLAREFSFFEHGLRSRPIVGHTPSPGAVAFVRRVMKQLGELRGERLYKVNDGGREILQVGNIRLSIEPCNPGMLLKGAYWLGRLRDRSLPPAAGWKRITIRDDSAGSSLHFSARGLLSASLRAMTVGTAGVTALALGLSNAPLLSEASLPLSLSLAGICAFEALCLRAARGGAIRALRHLDAAMSVERSQQS